MYFYIPPYQPPKSRVYFRRAILSLTLVVIVSSTLILSSSTLRSEISKIPGALVSASGDTNSVGQTVTTSRDGESSGITVVGETEQPEGTIPGRVGPTSATLNKAKTLTVTQNGALIENVDVEGQITVQADNVTIRNFRANNVIKGPGFKGLVLEDGEIHGKDDSTLNGVAWSEFTARRLNIYGLDDGIKAHGNVVIENCWIHDLAFVENENGTTHNDGVQVSSGSNVIIRNSRFENIRGTAAVFIKTDQGAISDVTVENNILGGGAYSLYVVGTDKHGYPTNVKILNNTFLNENIYGSMSLDSSKVTVSGNKNS